MTLFDIALLFFFILLAYGFWRHADASRLARASAKKYCDKTGVQFLDQSVVLDGVTIGRSSQSLFLLKRRYTFEFATTGDRRYKGKITLHGLRVADIELAPYKTP